MAGTEVSNSSSMTLPMWGLLISLLCFPLIVMSGQKFPSTLYFVCCFFSLCLLVSAYGKRPFAPENLLQQYRTLFICSSVMLLSVLLSKAVNWDFHGTELEKALRFSVTLPLLIAATRYIPERYLKHILWGVYAAIVWAFVFVVSLEGPKNLRPETTSVFNAVTYGLVVLILSAMATYSIRVSLTAYPRAEKIFKVLITLLGLSAFLITQTRSGFVLVPFLLVFGILVRKKNQQWHKVVNLLLIAVVIVGVLVFALPQYTHRLLHSQNEMAACTANPLSNGSLCVRVQLWQASLDMTERRPWFGSGNNSHFQQELIEYYEPRKVVSAYTAKNFGEPHNDYLQALSSFGIFGLLGLLFMYFVPAVVFLARLFKQPRNQERAFAAMGAAITIGFALSSVFELIFRGMRMVGFYSVLVAVLLVLSAPYSQTEPQGSNTPKL